MDIYHILPCNVFIFVLFFNLKHIMPTLLFISAVKRGKEFKAHFLSRQKVGMLIVKLKHTQEIQYLSFTSQAE